MDAVEWQTWANPEFLRFDTGIRLEFQPPEVQRAELALVEASLSPRGYRLVRDMMLINGFLGEVVGLENILNERPGMSQHRHHIANPRELLAAGRSAATPRSYGMDLLRWW